MQLTYPVKSSVFSPLLKLNEFYLCATQSTKNLHDSYSLKRCHLHLILCLFLSFHAFQRSLNHVTAISNIGSGKNGKCFFERTGKDTDMEFKRRGKTLGCYGSSNYCSKRLSEVCHSLLSKQWHLVKHGKHKQRNKPIRTS